MRIYYADIRGADEARALYPGTSKHPGSAFGISLMAAAYEDYSGKAVMPKIEHSLLHRSVFFPSPELHYSISHSKTHVICALSEHPVGIDTEPSDRRVSEKTAAKLATPAELEFLSFLELWTLRESYFKLTNEGDLRTLRFYRRLGKIIAPREDVFCRQYKNVEGAVISVCAYEDDFPDDLTKIPLKSLMKKEKPLQSYPKGFRLD